MWYHLNDHVLMTEKWQMKTAIRGINTHVFCLPNIKNCFVHLKTCSHEVAGYFIFICENKIVEACEK